MIAIAQLAEHLVQIKTGMSRTREWEKVMAMSVALLGIDADSLAGLEAECDGVVHDRRSALPAEQHHVLV
jgi:hypothetical protein